MILDGGVIVKYSKTRIYRFLGAVLIPGELKNEKFFSLIIDIFSI